MKIVWSFKCDDVLIAPQRPHLYHKSIKNDTYSKYFKNISNIWFWIRQNCFQIIRNSKFEIFVLFLISLNMIIMSFTHSNEGDTWHSTLMYLDLCFTILFTIEMMLKCIGLGIKQYVGLFFNFLKFF